MIVLSPCCSYVLLCVTNLMIIVLDIIGATAVDNDWMYILLQLAEFCAIFPLNALPSVC